MESKTQTFKNEQFIVIKGLTHPEYSYFTFEQEEKEFREKYWNIKSGDIVFDVGASYGAYTLSALSVGAKVYTFEPESTVCADLYNNVKINNWLESCYIMNYGLWNCSSFVDMASYATHWPTQTITGSYKMRALDQVVDEAKISKLDWIKIDVEGAEEYVIRGGLKTIEKFKPKLIIECHIFLDNTLVDKIKSLLIGYKFEEIDRSPCTMLLAIPS